MLKQLQIPVPVPSFKLLFYRVDIKLQKKLGEPEFAVSNKYGLVHVTLDPSSNVYYCVMEESKALPLVVPPDDGNTKYDKKCLEKQQSTCDLILTTANANVSVNFPSYCPWGTPCIHYTGPLPP